MLFTVALNPGFKYSIIMEKRQRKRYSREVYIEMNLLGNPFMMHAAFFQYKWSGCKIETELQSWRTIHRFIVYRHKCPIWLLNMLQAAVKGFFGSFLFLRKRILILLNVHIMQVAFTVWLSVNYPLNQWKEQTAIVWFKIKGWRYLNVCTRVYFLFL